MAILASRHGELRAPAILSKGTIILNAPHERSWVSIDDLMPEDWRANAHDGCSLCVTGQFKLLAYMVTVNRRTGIITSADHLHPYQLH